MVILVYMFLSVLTVTNMLVGVVCDLITNASDEKRQEDDKEALASDIKNLLSALDTDKNGMLTKDEFLGLLFAEDATRILADAGVDVGAVFKNVDFIFEDESKELSFEQVMDYILAFRDPQVATFIQHNHDM